MGLGGSFLGLMHDVIEKGKGNREQGTDKKQKFLSLKLSQKKDVFKRCIARKKQCHYFNLMFLNMSFFC
ncbi:MAG: hypothetical protein RLZZ507_2110 [Cyanobacteriota bacterium]|jgi:hypothetical protein